VKFILDSTHADNSGSRNVMPMNSRRYTLMSAFLFVVRPIGSVDITVNLNVCRLATSVANIEGVLKMGIRDALISSPAFGGCYFPAGWGVHLKITSNNFSFSVSFKKSYSYFPDPTVTLGADFNIIAVRDTSQVAYRSSPKALVTAIHSNVTVSRWAWVYPGAIPGLAIALSFARENAQRNSKELTQKITDAAFELMRIYNGIPVDLQLHHVRLYETAGGDGTMDGLYCPVSPALNPPPHTS
jgi:hypothetical protein